MTDMTHWRCELTVLADLCVQCVDFLEIRVYSSNSRMYKYRRQRLPWKFVEILEDSRTLYKAAQTWIEQ
jgi:hypothetical protein